jgi:uncharacterized membrane protein
MIACLERLGRYTHSLAYLLAGIICLLLWIQSLVSIEWLGCGDGDICSKVNHGPGSHVLGVPTALFGAFIYLLFGGAFAKGLPSRLEAPFVYGAAGITIIAAASLLSVQWALYQDVCKWCLLAHCLGCVGAIARAYEIGIGLVIRSVVAFIIGGTCTFLVLYSSITGSVALMRSPMATDAMNRNSLELMVDRLPVLGSGDKTNAIVCLFDYTCAYCRALHFFLESEQERPWDIVCLPVPVNPDCNRFVRQRLPEHQNACVLARIALAVWVAEPAAFAGFHSYLFEQGPTITESEAWIKASALIGRNRLEVALASDDVAKLLQLGVSLYGMPKAGVRRGTLPQLFVGDFTIFGVPKSREELLFKIAANVGRMGSVSNTLFRRWTNSVAL